MERSSPAPGSNQILFLIASVRHTWGAHPITVLALGLFCVVPGFLLASTGTRPSPNRLITAELFGITRRARLVQSFQADPAASPPQVWKKRLSPEIARDRWTRHGHGLWWLVWLDDGKPVLVLPKASNPSSLDLLFADELHRKSFDQATPLEKRSPSALEQTCLELITRGTAVQWQPSGLASISGPLFPALTSVSHGCFSVVLKGNRLMAEGPVAPRPLASLKDAQAKGHANRVGFDAPSNYLELNSVSLQPLLGSFLNNPLISEQLTSRYGLAEELRDVLLAAPVALRVSSLATGRFKASVQARLMVPAKHLPKLEDSLDAVATALVRRGFQREQHALQMLKEPSSNRVAEVWLDSNGDLSGGWSLGPETQGQVELLLALGEAPTLGPHPLKRLGQQRLRLRGRPDELVQLGWLGRGWPRVIRNASQLELEMTALPKQQQPGWLRLQMELR